MDEFVRLLASGVISGTVISAILTFFFNRRTTEIQEQIKDQYERSMAVFQSTRAWKEQSVSELLGPMYMQFDRTRRAFGRWRNKNLFLESKVIREGNLIIRDLLLTKGYLIPPELLDDAGKLVEHYDRWLEEFEKKRSSEQPDLDSTFVFVGPEGFPFPRQSEAKFKAKFEEMWAELYSQDESPARRA
jgi:hypothetical protein